MRRCCMLPLSACMHSARTSCDCWWSRYDVIFQKHCTSLCSAFAQRHADGMRLSVCLSCCTSACTSRTACVSAAASTVLAWLWYGCTPARDALHIACTGTVALDASACTSLRLCEQATQQQSYHCHAVCRVPDRRRMYGIVCCSTVGMIPNTTLHWPVEAYRCLLLCIGQGLMSALQRFELNSSFLSANTATAENRPDPGVLHC